MKNDGDSSSTTEHSIYLGAQFQLLLRQPEGLPDLMVSHARVLAYPQLFVPIAFRLSLHIVGISSIINLLLVLLALLVFFLSRLGDERGQEVLAQLVFALFLLRGTDGRGVMGVRGGRVEEPSIDEVA